ncbi:PAAR domain-containing protein [Ralstonia wenshanensis]|uniref:PAAR domain-containing protein n=1 Tax=Ralstonia wenshanensis TaxID=2842456 RepID=UPI002AAEA09B|nr:PAAR domain-containing protein [Ralstonia wenshanensis]MDY7508040.1 PAAR domain-containing protein [Ralstonia wenshanensis]
METMLHGGGRTMMRRIAVVGDTLLNGGTVLSYAGPACTFGNAGHQVALIGGQAYCEVCKSVGIITKAGGPRRMNFMGEVALDGDEVLCRCLHPKRIVAVLAGEAWYEDGSGSEIERQRANSDLANSVPTTAAVSPIYDEQFLLKDRQGNVLSDTYYTVGLPNGAIKLGTTDLLGRTERIRTDGVQEIRIYLGHVENIR